MLALVMVCLGSSLWAQGAGQASGQPARAVRLSYVDGAVKLSQGGQVLAEQAAANTPLFEGMQLTTTDSGKAEIQLEDGSVARISPDSSLTLQVLRGSGTSADAELVVNSGLAYFELQGGGQAGQIGVQFGDSVVTTSGFTVLRVVMDNPPGQLAVFSGNAHLQGGNGALSVDLHGGESITLNGADPSQYNLAESIEPDSWDAWNSDRDQALTAQADTGTGAPANLGATQNPAWSDLDANGSWYDVPGQGEVWSPYDAANAGFDPYGVGNWMWTPGFGYIWTSGYPWGYLPYQCGAWNFYTGFGWGWAPGMGGCMPWWGMGLYPGLNIGYVPPGYRVIPRPIVPRRPINGNPLPMVAVNRKPLVLTSGLPSRDKGTLVSIAGNSVQPMAALPARGEYDHTGPTYLTAKTIGSTSLSARPSYVSNRSAGAPATPGANRSVPAGRSSLDGASHPSGSSHPSGGFSGGTSHPSGGGGGASHSSGGGGGAHH